MQNLDRPGPLAKFSTATTFRLLLSLLLLAAAVIPTAHAQTYSLLYSFTGGSDGANPNGQLILDASGNLYGPASIGGDLSCDSVGCGVIFELTQSGAQSVLHTFTGSDGQFPSGTLALDSFNNLYGTTSQGGLVKQSCIPLAKPQGCGVIFKLNRATGKLTVLHRFAGGADGAEPNGLIRDSAGNLYGTTYLGGTAGCGNNETCGTIYKVDPAGTHTVLYGFTGGTDGGLPISVIRDSSGNFYGMTLVGGDLSCQPNTGQGSGCGTVFELTAAGTLKVLHAFTGGKDGQNIAADAASSAGLIRNSAGTLFGTSPLGGLQDCANYPGCGVVFSVNPNTEKEKVLHSFDEGPNGALPSYSLTSDPAGNLYSTTTLGGYTGGPCSPAGCGNVFALTPSGKLTILYSFTDSTDGYYPTYVTSDASGNLYGETTGGGGNAGSAGTIFQIIP
jgi:uncharacterized repeat protein (TIGR03803 family)